jgi:hypothetical protein
MEPIEASPQMIFWNGEPICSSFDMETRMIGPNDVGFQTGGNQNIVMATDLKDPINKLAFPPIVHQMAKERKGMFIFDAGILFDKNGQAYFTEFAGNRWGWGGVFSELSMARKGERVASEYFEAVAQGKNPQKYKYGTTLSLYNLQMDKQNPGLFKDGMPFQWEESTEKSFFPYQVRKEEHENKGEDEVVQKRSISMSVGSTINLLGYTTGFGNTVKEAVDNLYNTFEDKVYMGGMYYRSKQDFLSTDYTSALMNRVNFVLKHGLTTTQLPKKDDSKDVVESYVRAISKLKKY